ncbi:UNVERIFIED_ORG: hypothetical protein J2740_005571 [Rhizobium nepotum]|nr:hypothetical protein [Rhizobium nepotum]
MTRINARQRRREATCRRGYEDGKRAALSAADATIGTQLCECTKVEQDETCPIGTPSLLCEVCDGEGHVPYVKLDGPELWEIVFGINSDAAADITDQQYDLIAKHINEVFVQPLRSNTALGSEGLKAIAAERSRQIEQEGWTAHHDDAHGDGSIALAAACYAMFAAVSDNARGSTQLPGSLTNDGKEIEGWAAFLSIWPWERRFWKPTTRVRDLEKAGALIAAELDRLIRAAAPAKQERSH